MADRWMDERDREWRERDWRRSEAYARGEAHERPDEARRFEERSWAGPGEDPGRRYPPRGARRGYRYEDEDYHGRTALTAGGPAPSVSRPERPGARFTSQDYTGRSYADESGRADYGYLPRQGADYGRAEDYSYARSYRADRDREERRAWESGGGHRGVGPKGYQRSDERISDEAHDRLTDDPWLDASAIELVVRAGEITLSGHVESREAKHRAEHLVEDLSGVRHVQNNLRVDPDGGLTGSGRGFGSSAVEAEMRRNETAPGTAGRASSGLWGRTSTGAREEQPPEPGTKRN